MYRLAIVCFALLLGSTAATTVNKCKSNEPFPLSVEIEDCDEMPCIVIKGTTVIMKVHFVGTRDNTAEITALVHATALGITVPYSLPANVSAVCNNLLYDAICPIDKTEDVVYNFAFDIDSSYPEISVKVKLNLVDESEDSIACFITDIKVRKG